MRWAILFNGTNFGQHWSEYPGFRLPKGRHIQGNTACIPTGRKGSQKPVWRQHESSLHFLCSCCRVLCRAMWLNFCSPQIALAGGTKIGCVAIRLEAGRQRARWLRWSNAINHFKASGLVESHCGALSRYKWDRGDYEYPLGEVIKARDTLRIRIEHIVCVCVSRFKQYKQSIAGCVDACL